MSKKQSIGVLQLLVIISLVAWVTDVSARPKGRDYLELSLGLLGHGSAADPVGVTLGPGASIGLGGSADQLGFTLGAVVAADRRVQQLGDGPGFGFLQIFFDLEFMQSRRPTRTDVYFIAGATGMAAATEETTLQAYGLRLGAGVDIPITDFNRGSYFRKSQWLVSFRGVGSGAVNVPVSTDPFPVRFDLFLEAQLKVHFTIF